MFSVRTREIYAPRRECAAGCVGQLLSLGGADLLRIRSSNPPSGFVRGALGPVGTSLSIRTAGSPGAARATGSWNRGAVKNHGIATVATVATVSPGADAVAASASITAIRIAAIASVGGAGRTAITAIANSS